MRLNPNVPTKTRGNAALVARFGHGRGPSHVVGAFPGGPAVSFKAGTDLTEPERLRLTDELWATVLRTSAGADRGTDPALVVLRRRPPSELYWAAVRRIVTLDEVHRWLKGTDPLIRSALSGVGQIGAAAALAWPGHHPTWEAIAYRSPNRWGTERQVDGESVRRSAARHPALFLCTDPRTRRVLVTPHTACPILFGIRATEPGEAVAALGEIRSEPIERWLLYRTNQGTGDHVRRPWPVPPVSFSAGTLTGHIAALPQVRPGGHVLLLLEIASRARIRCAVFEPTKTLPKIAQTLAPGDRVRLWGGSLADGVFRVEGIDLLALEHRKVPGENPRCPYCGHRMGSLGAGRGFRCRSCRERSPPEARMTTLVPSQYTVGRYHPTPSARRHLAPRGPEPKIPR